MRLWVVYVEQVRSVGLSRSWIGYVGAAWPKHAKTTRKAGWCFIGYLLG